jgi:hypothetical protein
MFDLPSPRHISTLREGVIDPVAHGVRLSASRRPMLRVSSVDFDPEVLVGWPSCDINNRNKDKIGFLSRWNLDGSNLFGETAAAGGAGAAVCEGPVGKSRSRPAEARNRKTLAAAILLDGEAEALPRKAVELAPARDPWTFSPRT